MRYLFTGGGTGGHVYPALAIAAAIRQREPGADFLYVGLRGKLEARVVPQHGMPLRFVHSRPYPRSTTPGPMIAFLLSLGVGTAQALGILLRFRPELIVCTGGYVSAPVMFAHGLLTRVGLSRARVFVYEPNAYPGLLNQRVARLAHRIGLAFEHAGRWFDMKRVAVVGYPVRREVGQVGREEARQRLDIPVDRQVVLVFGGSGGSRVINEAVVEALPVWRQRTDLLTLHITGQADGPEYRAVAETGRHLERLGIAGDTSSWYRRFEYMDDIPTAYAAADLVVCRGGAGTLTEVCVCGLPALVIPLVTAAEDHQAVNARQLESQGAAQVLYQQAWWDGRRVTARVSSQALAAQVLALLDAPETRRQMSAAARAVPRRDSLELVRREIDDLLADRRPAPLALEFPLQLQTPPADPTVLLRSVQKRLEEVGGPSALEPRELAYLRYQADRLLMSERWYEIPLGRRSVGVKLVGCLQYREHLPLLLGILLDRTPVSPMRRLFGGDFHHGGIVRRNVIEYGLRGLGADEPQVESALLQALREDPYFEARAAAAQLLGERFRPSVRSETALLAALDDPVSRVVVQAIRALGFVAQRPAVLERLRRFYLHPDGQYRQEVVTALRHLLERGVIDPAAVAADLDQILATSPDFRPRFPLKDNLHQLAEILYRTPSAAPRNGGMAAEGNGA